MVSNLTHMEEIARSHQERPSCQEPITITTTQLVEITTAGVEIILVLITAGEIATTIRTEAVRRVLRTRDGIRMETQEVAGGEARSHHQIKMGAEASRSRHRIKTILAGERETIINLTIKAIPDGAMATRPMIKPIIAGVITITTAAITTDGAVTTISLTTKATTIAGAIMASRRIKEVLIGATIPSPTIKVAPVGAMTIRIPAPVGTISRMAKVVGAGATTISQTTKVAILVLGAIIITRTAKEISLTVGVAILNRMIKATVEAGMAGPIPMIRITTLDGVATTSPIIKGTTMPMDGVKATTPVISQMAKEITMDGAKATTPVISQMAKEIMTQVVGIATINPMVRMATRPIGVRAVTTESLKALGAKRIALTIGGPLLRRPGVLTLLKAPIIMATTVLEMIGTVEGTTTRGEEALAMAGEMEGIITRVVELLDGAVMEMIILAAEALVMAGEIVEMMLQVAEILVIIGTVEEITIRAVETQAGEVAMAAITLEEVMDGEAIKTTTREAEIGVVEEIITLVEVMDGEITTREAETLAVAMAGVEIATLAAEILTIGAMVETTTQGVATLDQITLEEAILDGEAMRERNPKEAGEAIACEIKEVETRLSKLAIGFGLRILAGSALTSAKIDGVGVCRNFGGNMSCSEVAVISSPNFARNCTKIAYRHARAQLEVVGDFKRSLLHCI